MRSSTRTSTCAGSPGCTHTIGTVRWRRTASSTERLRSRQDFVPARERRNARALLHSKMQARSGGQDARSRSLRYLGGASALASALRIVPADDRAAAARRQVPRARACAAGRPARHRSALRLTAAETFGELDVRSLLRTFRVPNAVAVADGWGGGRLALYTSPSGETIAALALRWDTVEDAAEWRDAVARYVAAAFPGATAATARRSTAAGRRPRRDRGRSARNDRRPRERTGRRRRRGGRAAAN